MNYRMRFALLVAIVATALIPTTTTGATMAPYGGCKESWQAPKSDGAEWCRNHGWTVRPRIVVGPRKWVRYSRLPSCAVEDASRGPVPCSWNFDKNDGNGRGDAYYATPLPDGKHVRFHAVRGVR